MLQQKARPPVHPAAVHLGAELRTQRKRMKDSLQDVADKIGKKKLAVYRWENNGQVPDDADFRRLCDALAVSNSLREQMDRLRHESRTTDWLIPAPTGYALAQFAWYERHAKRLTTGSARLIPGLLQTEGYISELMHQDPTNPREVRDAVEYRLGRQHVIGQQGRRGEPLHLHAYIADTALKFPPVSAATAAEQLAHVREAAKRKNVTVQIVQIVQGVHVPIEGVFNMFDFERVPSVVFDDSYRLSRVSPADVPGYIARIAQIEDRALTVKDSAGLISDWHDHWSSQAETERNP